LEARVVVATTGGNTSFPARKFQAVFAEFRM
jgi:hypothetical protein